MGSELFEKKMFFGRTFQSWLNNRTTITKTDLDFLKMFSYSYWVRKQKETTNKEDSPYLSETVRWS